MGLRRRGQWTSHAASTRGLSTVHSGGALTTPSAGWIKAGAIDAAALGPFE